MWRRAALTTRRALSTAPPVPRPLSTWQCDPADGAVARNGVLLDASLPCNWELADALRAERMPNASCAGAELLASIERQELDRRSLQVVLVRHTEDLSWSEPFAGVRTVYEKPGREFAALPATVPSAASGPAAPDADRVVLPNVGKEQHAYLTHIVRNYDGRRKRRPRTLH